VDLGVPGPGPGCQACFRAARPVSGAGAVSASIGAGSGSCGGSCRQERWRATARSTASARLVGSDRGALPGFSLAGFL